MERRERLRNRFTPYSRLSDSDGGNTREDITNRGLLPLVASSSLIQALDKVIPRPPPGSPGQSNTTFFENANNFVMNQPIIGNIQITQKSGNSTVLRDMLEHVIPGAEYDSSARDTPPRCHPGTRTRILKEVQTRIHDPSMATRMIWIHGAAGVGKSAVMQTLAEAESTRQTIFTTLFFSRPNERDNPKKAFTTLAYGLAVLNLDYQNYIEDRFQDDPTFFKKSLEEQFRRFFVLPFLENRINFGSQRWVVFLDGLDECRGEREQCRIVDLISDSVLCHWSSTPFIWVIASRPEAHLKMLFTKAKTSLEIFWELEVPIDSDESSQDVERYLHAQFSQICESNPDSVPLLWPSESDFLTLSQTSSGLFVFASTLVGYLLDGDPVSRLKYILSLIERSRALPSFNPQQNPFQMLDLLYTQIMSDVPKEVLSIVVRLLGFYLLQVVLAFEGTPPSLLVTSNILGLEQHTVYAALRKLYSVLGCPPPRDAARHPLRFLHASFSDFLCDQSRSRTYHINLNQEVVNTWLRYSKILCQYETNRSHTCVDISWSPQGARRAAIQEEVLAVVRKRWMSTLFLSTDGITEVHELIEEPIMVEIFQGLGSVIFTCPSGTHIPITMFLTWLSNHAPLDLQINFLRGTVPFHSLDIDRLIKSLCTYQWCYSVGSGALGGFYFNNINVAAAVQFDAAQWEEAKAVLWTHSGLLDHLVQAPGGTTSTILGFDPAKRFVVIGPIDIWSLDQQTYYILPYSDEFAT